MIVPPSSFVQYSQTATWPLVTIATNGRYLSQGQTHLSTQQEKSLQEKGRSATTPSGLEVRLLRPKAEQNCGLSQASHGVQTASVVAEGPPHP